MCQLNCEIHQIRIFNKFQLIIENVFKKWSEANLGDFYGSIPKYVKLQVDLFKYTYNEIHILK